MKVLTRDRLGEKVGWLPFLLVATGLVWAWSGPGRLASEEVDSEQNAEERRLAAKTDDPDLLVDFDDGVSRAELETNPWIEEAISAYSATDKLYRIRFPNPVARDQAMVQLKADPTVTSVDYDLSMALPVEATTLADRPGADCKATRTDSAHKGFPNDPCFRYQWHLDQVRASSAWKLGQGQGAVVAVIDTGVTRVADLAQTQFVAGYNFVNNNSRSDDDHGHGTHVAGTIAQATNNALGVAGVAFGARIMPLKVLSAQGSGSIGGIAQAIRYAADHGANVINMSLGGPLPATTLRQAVEYAYKKGVTVIAAAGNDGRGRVSYPARYVNAIGVAATQFDESATFYSNWGQQIDIAAPGGNVRVDQNGDGMPDGVLQNTIVPGNIRETGYLFFMGTSMASPHVAGVAALLAGAGVTRPEKLEQLLIQSARTPRGQKRSTDGARIDDHFGAGIVDAEAALNALRTKRDGGALALGATLALGLCVGRRRRMILGLRGICGLGAGLAAGIAMPLGIASTMGPHGLGNPLLLSPLLPVLAIGLFFGIRRTRPALAGLCAGLAGLLLSVAIAHTTDVQFVPDLLDRVWLVAGAAIAVAMSHLTLRNE
jgi:serine protease